MPVKPVTKEEILKSNGVETFDTYNPLYENVKRAMDSWAALQTGERDERIAELEKAMTNLIEAIPPQYNDRDWWPDSLTNAVEQATQLLTDKK